MEEKYIIEKYYKGKNIGKAFEETYGSKELADSVCEWLQAASTNFSNCLKYKVVKIQ